MSSANFFVKLPNGNTIIDANRDGIIEAKEIKVEETLKVKNLIVEDNIKSSSFTLNNQNFTTNNNSISSGIDGISSTVNDRIDFSKNIKLDTGKSITGDNAILKNVNLNGVNVSTKLSEIDTNLLKINSNTTKINQNEAERINNDNDILNNSNRITQNTNKILTNETNISNNLLSIQSNSTKSNNNNSKIEQNTINISNNINSISNNKTSIDANVTTINNNTTTINNNTTSINNNTTSINTNSSNIQNIGNKIDNFTINPTNINITNKDFFVNDLPSGNSSNVTGTTNIQLKTNGDIISKKLNSENIINTNNLTTKSINVETLSQKQSDGTYKSFDLNNLSTTNNNNPTTSNADNLISSTDNTKPIYVKDNIEINKNLILGSSVVNSTNLSYYSNNNTYSFDGSNFVELKDVAIRNNTTGPRTYSFDFRLNPIPKGVYTLATIGHLDNLTTGDRNEIILSTIHNSGTTGQIIFLTKDGGFKERTDARLLTIHDGNQHNITIIIQSQTVTFYLDGTLYASPLEFNSANEIKCEPSGILLGTHERNSNERFNGYILKFELFDVALTSSQIQTRYNNIPIINNDVKFLRNLQFTKNNPSIDFLYDDEVFQLNNGTSSQILLSGSKNTKIKAKEIEGNTGKFTNLTLNGNVFDPSTFKANIDGITSDSINGITFSEKSKFEKKLTTLSDYNLSNKIINDTTNGLVITANDATLDKLNLKNLVGLLENLPYTAELSNYVDLTQNFNIPSTPDILYNKNVDVFERLIVRQPDPNNSAFGTHVYQNSGDDYIGSTSTVYTKNGTSITESGEYFQANFTLPVQISRWILFNQLNDFSSQPQEIVLVGSNNNQTWEHIQDYSFTTQRIVGDTFVHYEITTGIDDFKTKVPLSTINTISTSTVQGTSVNGRVYIDKTIQTTNFYKHYRWIVKKVEAFNYWSINELELFGLEKKTVDVAVKIKQVEDNLNSKTNHIVQNFTGSNGGVKLNTEIINNTRDIYTPSLIVNPTTGTKKSYLINIDGDLMLTTDGGKPNVRFRDAGKKIEFTAEELEVISDSGTTKVLEKFNNLDTKFNPITLSNDEYQFSKGLFVNGKKSTNTPSKNGVFMGIDSSGNTGVELAGISPYIDFSYGQSTDSNNRLISSNGKLTISGDVEFPNNITIAGQSLNKFINPHHNLNTSFQNISGNNLKNRDFAPITQMNVNDFVISLKYTRTIDVFVGTLFRIGNDLPYIYADITNSGALHFVYVSNTNVTHTYYYPITNDLNMDHHLMFRKLNNELTFYIDGHYQAKFITTTFVHPSNHVMFGYKEVFLQQGQHDYQFEGTITHARIINDVKFDEIAEIVKKDFNSNIEILQDVRAQTGSFTGPLATGRDFNTKTNPAGVYLGTYDNKFGNIQLVSNDLTYGSWIDFVDGNNNNNNNGDFLGRIRALNNEMEWFYKGNRILLNENSLKIESGSLQIKDKFILTTNGNSVSDNHFYFAVDGLKFGSDINKTWELVADVDGDKILLFKNGQKRGRIAIEDDGGGTRENFQLPSYVPNPTQGGIIDLLSDDRLKYDETDVNDALTSINQIKITNYKMHNKIMSKEEEEEIEESENNSRIFTGVIAQDLLKIPSLKHCVIEPENPETEAYKVDYFSLFCKSIKAIQELNKRVEDLENILNI